MKEIVILSGKGGTGKTSISGCLAFLADHCIIADCDVDAADLHLILKHNKISEEPFIGGKTAAIDSNVCNNCGICAKLCRFGAVNQIDKKTTINKYKCEGCKVCAEFCPQNAITMEDSVSGTFYVSATQTGKFIHARLVVSGENSGKLVTKIRNVAKQEAESSDAGFIITDGSPGIGCPVIASVTGADYILIVTEPTISGLHDLQRLFKLLSFFGSKAGVVVNRYNINNEKTIEIEKATKEAKYEFLGKIPVDHDFIKAQLSRCSLMEFTKSPTTEIIEKIWQQISKRN